MDKELALNYMIDEAVCAYFTGVYHRFGGGRVHVGMGISGVDEWARLKKEGDDVLAIRKYMSKAAAFCTRDTLEDTQNLEERMLGFLFEKKYSL